jgi:glutaredoxin
MATYLNDQPRGPAVVLYTRRGCHLCEEVRFLLEQHGIVPMCVDIDADPQLRERFDTCVPVVEIDGRIRFRGRVEAALLRRIIQRSVDERGEFGDA